MHFRNRKILWNVLLKLICRSQAAGWSEETRRHKLNQSIWLCKNLCCRCDPHLRTSHTDQQPTAKTPHFKRTMWREKLSLTSFYKEYCIFFLLKCINVLYCTKKVQINIISVVIALLFPKALILTVQRCLLSYVISSSAKLFSEHTTLWHWQMISLELSQCADKAAHLKATGKILLLFCTTKHFILKRWPSYLMPTPPFLSQRTFMCKCEKMARTSAILLEFPLAMSTTWRLANVLTCNQGDRGAQSG